MTSNPSPDFVTIEQDASRRTVGRYFIGVDIGQANDPTAIVGVQKHEAFHVELDELGDPFWKPDAEAEFRVGKIERLPLNTPYPGVVRHVRELVSRPPYADNSDLVIDYTGVGRPVFDLFNSQGINPIGVTITGGSSGTREGMIYRVPKAVLVARVQTLFHEKRLKIAKNLPEAAALVAELQDFRSEVSDTGNWKFNARSGKHDDIVLTLAIAIWRATANVDGLFEYYRRLANGTYAPAPNGKPLPQHLVKLRAPAGISNVHTRAGGQLCVDANGCITVW